VVVVVVVVVVVWCGIVAGNAKSPIGRAITDMSVPSSSGVGRRVVVVVVVVVVFLLS